MVRYLVEWYIQLQEFKSMNDAKRLQMELQRDSSDQKNKIPAVYIFRWIFMM